MASMSLRAALGAALSHNKDLQQPTGPLGGLQALVSCHVQVWWSLWRFHTQASTQITEGLSGVLLT